MVNHLKIARKWPYVLFFICGLFSLLGYALILFCLPVNDPYTTWASQITVGFFITYFTVVMVDGSFQEQEEQERKRIGDMALIECRKPLNRHLELLRDWYIISLLSVPEDSPTTLEEILDDDYYNQISHLDLSAEVNDGVATEASDWFEYSLNNISQFRSELDEVLARYGHSMNPLVFERIRSVFNSPLLTIFSDLEEHLVDEEFEPPDFTTESWEKDILEHIKSINGVLDLYESEGEGPNIWEETIGIEDPMTPEVGSARLDGETELEKRSSSE